MKKSIFWINSILSYLAFIPTAIVAPLALFLFDAPGSRENLVNWLLFWSMLTFPVVIGIGLFIGIRLFKNQEYWLAAAVSSAFYVNIMLLIIANTNY